MGGLTHNHQIRALSLLVAEKEVRDLKHRNIQCVVVGLKMKWQENWEFSHTIPSNKILSAILKGVEMGS